MEKTAVGGVFCLQTCNLDVNNGVSTLAKFDGHIYH